MRCRIELSDVENIALVFENGGFVIIDIEIVGGGKQGHDRRETGGASFAIHAIADQDNFNAVIC